jgi:hypothetical protein
MVRQAHHERNQHLTVRPEPFGYAQESLVERLVQSFLKLNTRLNIIHHAVAKNRQEIQWGMHLIKPINRYRQ